jgi:hypothetical protein
MSILVSFSVSMVFLLSDEGVGIWCWENKKADLLGAGFLFRNSLTLSLAYPQGDHQQLKQMEHPSCGTVLIPHLGQMSLSE